MALDLPKLNFFNRLSARGRIVFLFATIIGFLFAIYMGTRYFSSSQATGPSHVAEAPRGLQSIPGGQMTPEYQRAIEQANVQRAQQAQITGHSAIPTLINVAGQTTNGGCIICLDQSANIKYQLDDWLKQGKVLPEIANALIQYADKNPVVIAFADKLSELTKEDKLSPEQARELLETYKKQHVNALLQDSAKIMDPMIKSGQLPLDDANQLLLDQKNVVPPNVYSFELQKMVKEGNISTVIAAQLLSQYTQQRSKEIIFESIAILHRLGRNGELIPDIEKKLIELELQMVPLTDFSNTLQQYVTSGKLAPVVSDKILAEYKQQKAEMGAAIDTLSQLVDRASVSDLQQIKDLVAANKLSQDAANQIAALEQTNPSVEALTAAINQMVQQNKLSPEVAKQLIDNYKTAKALQDLKQRLTELQANNASPPLYAEELKKAVQSGLITPEEATELLQEYQALTSRPIMPTTVGGGKNDAFAKLQQQVQQNTANIPTSATQFTAAQSQAQVQSEQQAAQQQRDHIHELVIAMGGQAEKLVASWGPPNMTGKVGEKPAEKTTGKETGTGNGSSTGASGAGGENTGAPIIKAGSILFAVLDTAVNSDYPDSPVLATVVEGKYKNAKLLGKLITAKGVSGQMDRISLNFTLMDLNAWPKSKTVTAYAIDPDTARTSVASQVNYHYMMRFGATMATSFLQGYASSITNAGTSTTGIFGTSTTHNTLSPSSKIMVGLGQVGQTLGNLTQNYINIPPTVKVDSGVSLGILFMADVTQ